MKFKQTLRKAVLIGALVTVPLFVHSEPKNESIQKPTIESVSQKDLEKTVKRAFLLGFAVSTALASGLFGLSFLNNLQKAKETKKFDKVRVSKLLGEFSACTAGCFLWQSQGLPNDFNMLVFGGMTTMLVWDLTFHSLVPLPFGDKEN